MPKFQPTFTQTLGLLEKLQGEKQEVFLLTRIKHQKSLLSILGRCFCLYTVGQGSVIHVHWDRLVPNYYRKNSRY